MNAEQIDRALTDLSVDYIAKVRVIQAELQSSIEAIQRQVDVSVPKHIVSACFANFSKVLEKAAGDS
jgi:hypothetical protein